MPKKNQTKFFVFCLFLASNLISCTSPIKKEPSRQIASTQEASAESCKSDENLDWFNFGKYSIVKPPMSQGRWDEGDSNGFVAYNSSLPIVEGQRVEKWTSPFAAQRKAPTNRKEFFSRGTMYYFEVEGVEPVYQSAEANWRLLGPTIVGANSKINVYRIDKTPEALNQECPNGKNRGQYVASIPYFSLRTSGNRTNQMPKSSFKVKILKPGKWAKEAGKQYLEYIKTIAQAPHEINSLAKAIQETLGKDLVTDEILLNLKTQTREEFIDYYTSIPLKTDEEKLWKLGKLRNGMLWWKGQLEDAVSSAGIEGFQEALLEIRKLQSSFSEADAQGRNLEEALHTLNEIANKTEIGQGWASRLKKILQDKKNSIKPETSFLGMTALNLKAMWNDPSQMREALAWYMFEKAGVVAPQHTYAKLCFGRTYRGVFSVVEQIDESFLADRKLALGNLPMLNLYKVYMGTEDVGLDLATLQDSFSKIDLSNIANPHSEKAKVIDAFADNPYRGKRALLESPFRSLKPFSTWLTQSEYYFDNLGGGTLKVLKKVESSPQISPYFKAQSVENRTYQLQTDWDDLIKDQVKTKGKNPVYPVTSYQDLEQLINTINSGETPKDYESDTFFNRMNSVLDTKAFLRWAATTVLLGGWDNYYMNAQNYYLLNQTSLDLSSSIQNPKFLLLPWDYDQSFSMSFGSSPTLWWNTDILDWESMRREHRPDSSEKGSSRYLLYDQEVQRPLVTHLLKNPRFKAYYLRFIDWMIYNYFHPKNVASLIGKDFPMTQNLIESWKSTYSPLIPRRQKIHQVRIHKETWDDPKNEASNIVLTFKEREALEISKSDRHLTWTNFQKKYQHNNVGRVDLQGLEEGRCDQEPFDEPRLPKDIGQCQETDGQKAPLYPVAWHPNFTPQFPGLWSLIANSVYQEHMGLPQPRWDIMSRTGRQYRNSMIYENGYLGRRIIWKELWQENPKKCNRQYKIFEGIEHHVRERARTALARIDQELSSENGLDPKKYHLTFSDRKETRKLSLEDFLKLQP